MYHHTTMTDQRIRDLRATAAELRSARSDRLGGGWLDTIRVRTGTVLVAAGEALVSGARPATTSSATR